MEKLAGTKVSLQKVEGSQRLRGALGPLLCATAFGCWLNAGAAYALDVPPDAVQKEDAELLPVTLNPPGNSLVFGADENCVSSVQSPEDAAANVQMDVAGPENGTQMVPEEDLLAATAKPACIPLVSFAAAGEPVFAAHAAASGFGFSATLGQLAMFAGVPAAISQIAKAMGRKRGSNGGANPGENGRGIGRGQGPDGGAPGAGGPGGGIGGTPPTPTPEPASTVLLIAGAALVGRAVQRRAGR